MLVKRFGYSSIVWEEKTKIHWCVIWRGFRSISLVDANKIEKEKESICFNTLKVFQQQKKCLYRGGMFLLKDPCYQIKTMRLSKSLREDEICEVVKSRANEWFASDYSIDYQVIDTETHNEVIVQCFAVSKGIVEEVKVKFKKANLKLQAISILNDKNQPFLDGILQQNAIML